MPTWARVLIYAAGTIAGAILLFVIVYAAVRAALRAAQAEQRESSRRQEELLKTIATSAEYVADVADAWAEAEAERRALAGLPSPAPQGEEQATAGESSQ